MRTREAILRAAAEVLDESGFAGASITEIVKRAGATTGAMYFHFKSKDELARAVMDSQSETVLPYLGSKGLQRLVDITLVWSWQLQVDPMLRAGVRLAVEQGAFGVQDATSFHDWKRIMEECLDEALADEELREDVEPSELAEFVVSACTGTQLYSQLVSGRSDLPRRTVRMWSFLLPGVAVPETVERIDLDLRRGKGDPEPLPRPAGESPDDDA